MLRLLIAVSMAAAALACSANSNVTGTHIHYVDEGRTLQSSYLGAEPKVELRQNGSRWYLTVFQGRQSSAGYEVRIDDLKSQGTRIVVSATFVTPSPGAIVAEVLTSPAHTVSIPFGADEVVVYDQAGKQRARTSP